MRNFITKRGFYGALIGNDALNSPAVLDSNVFWMSRGERGEA
jgi:hypothetical protein